MTKPNAPHEERRKRRRVKAAVDARVTVAGEVFRARIYDVSWEGMTLLTGPRVPEHQMMKVEFEKKDGTPVFFELVERQRRHFVRDGQHVQRIGLSIRSSSDSATGFLMELGVARAQPRVVVKKSVGRQTTLPKPKTELSAQADESRESMDGSVRLKPERSHQRLQFQLPVLARVEGRIYRCHSLDIGTRGLAIQAPEEFPKAEGPFPLIYLDPDGGEIALRVRESNRKPLPGRPGFLRVGLAAVGGTKEFREFLKKHKLMSIH